MIQEINIQDVIKSLADCEDFQDFLIWIFKISEMEDMSITGEMQKDYYFLGRQSLAREIETVLKENELQAYQKILEKIYLEKGN